MKQTLNMRQQLSINFRYCYSSRTATQNMSATCNSPTIGLNLRASPLSTLTAWLHYLPRCVRSIVTCGITPTPPWHDVHLRKFVAMLLLRKKTLQSFATCFCRQRSGFSELQAHHCVLPKQWT